MYKIIKFSDNYIEPICVSCLNNHFSINLIKESKSSNFSSLQISVPLKSCINDCKSCIAKISPNIIKNDMNDPNFNKNYLNSLRKVKETGCKNIVLTSDKGEPIQNKKFLKKLGYFNNLLNNWFNIEIQTTGVLIDDNIQFLKNIGVKLISLSIFDIFDDENNFDIIQTKDKFKFNVKNLIKKIKDNNISVRLSVNLIKMYDNSTMQQIFDRIKELNPDQVTFKNLWFNDEENSINKWIKTNKASSNIINRISDYMENNNGKKISKFKYYYNGISVWLVNDCMVGNYVILKPNAKLYKYWGDKIPINI